MSETIRSRTILPLYFIFAIIVSIVCWLSLFVTSFSFFDMSLDRAFSIKTIIVGLLISVLACAAGGYVLGTLTNGLLKTWPVAIIYITPGILLRIGSSSLAFISDAVRDDIISKPGSMIVLPILIIIATPFTAYYSIRMGEAAADVYDEPKSVLNISWYHWLWILPFYLFSVVGVPTFLLLTLWWIDILTASIWPSLLNLPSLIPRIVVILILACIFTSISSVYSTLSERDSTARPLKALKVFGNWLLINALEAVIILAGIGKLMR